MVFLFIFRLLSENRLMEIHNKMFLGLHSLKILSLYDNMITCVMPGSFDYLTSLHTLYVITIFNHLDLETLT